MNPLNHDLARRLREMRDGSPHTNEDAELLTWAADALDDRHSSEEWMRERHPKWYREMHAKGANCERPARTAGVAP